MSGYVHSQGADPDPEGDAPPEEIQESGKIADIDVPEEVEEALREAAERERADG